MQMLRNNCRKGGRDRRRGRKEREREGRKGGKKERRKKGRKGGRKGRREGGSGMEEEDREGGME